MRTLITSFLVVFHMILHGQSPYQLSKKDYWLSGALLLSSASSYGLSTQAKGLDAEAIAALNPNQVNRLDRIAISNYNLDFVSPSEYLMYGSLALPSLMLWADEGRKDWITLGVIGTQGLMMSYTLRTLSKIGFNRPKPFMYRDDVDLEKKMEPESRHSFISGHATYAFYGATLLSRFYADYYPDSRYKIWVSAGAYTLAGTAAFIRTASGVHYATDVLAGAAAGTLCGYFITRIHKQKESPMSLVFTGNYMIIGYSF